ncbi:carboxymuconolactone decarboxylase family protein [Micromonospora sp. NPDC047557]|uniref:carboxymuconolactone decarboxylase family protein n=1 Tax=Micromonospora sp. NPDC047557 TaxID=3364250 RepID=UPI003715A106
MAPLLPPIDKPRGLIMKMVYVVSRRQFGRVMTPIKVLPPRMPLAFGSFYGKLPRLDRKLRLASQTALLIREQVASTNMCMFCMDAARWYVMTKTPDDLARLDALPEYQTSPLFTAAQRAALDYATELTRDKKVEPATFARLTRHYSEREVCDIVWLVASEHLNNMTNIGLGIGSDGFCELAQRAGTKGPVRALPAPPSDVARHRTDDAAAGTASEEQS